MESRIIGPERCVVEDVVFPTECAHGDPAIGARYHSLTTFVSPSED